MKKFMHICNSFFNREGNFLFIVFMRLGVPECVAQNWTIDVDPYPAGSIFPALWVGVF
jgi:hypothetical protein